MCLHHRLKNGLTAALGTAVSSFATVEPQLQPESIACQDAQATSECSEKACAFGLDPPATPEKTDTNATRTPVTPLKRNWRGAAPSAVVAFWHEHKLHVEGAMSQFDYGEGRDSTTEKSYRKKLKQRMKKVVLLLVIMLHRSLLTPKYVYASPRTLYAKRTILYFSTRWWKPQKTWLRTLSAPTSTCL